MRLGSAMAIALLLSACSAGTFAETQPHAPRTLGAHKPQRGPARAELPPAARDALVQLGFLAPSAPGTGHTASTALPYTMLATDQYVGAGGAGYLSFSGDVSVSPFGMTLQPGGTTFPTNFSYILYRVDDIMQAMTTLEPSFGLIGPGAQLGVAAYNWAYGTLGRWEPLYYGDASGGLSVDLQPPVGGNFISPGEDFAFVVFCLEPSSVEIQSLQLNSDTPNPNYDEVENNDDLQTDNALPLFPFNGWRGNVGPSGGYDADTDDYFYFFGNVGDMYKFTITPAIPNPVFNPYAYDSNEIEIGEYVTDSSGVVTVTVLVTTNQLQPLLLDVYHEGLATDYTIDGELVTGYGEVENNDAEAEANPQPGSTFVVNGNLGSGPINYDGDLVDWFSFTSADFDKRPLLVLWYDSALMSFDFLNDPPLITDSMGVVLAIGQASAIPDTAVFDFPDKITGFEVLPLLVELDPVGGSSNYWLNRFPDRDF